MESFRIPHNSEVLQPDSALSRSLPGSNSGQTHTVLEGDVSHHHAHGVRVGQPPIITQGLLPPHAGTLSPDGSRLAASSVMLSSFTATPSIFPQSFTFPLSTGPFSLDPNSFYPPSFLSLQHPSVPSPRSLNISEHPAKRARSYSHNVSSMAGEVKQRSRNLSHSSVERDLLVVTNSIDVSTDAPDLDSKSGTSSPNLKKRSFHSLQDAADYPRRRAIIAVSYRLSRPGRKEITKIDSVKYVDLGNQDAMAPSLNANSVQS
jgi:hypothetical protein